LTGIVTDLWQNLIERIHAAAPQTVVVVTGGGSSAISDLLAIPGGSRSLLEAVVPYSEAALTDWLGRAPEHFCSEETALAMAAVARQRACRLLFAQEPVNAGGQSNEHAPETTVTSRAVGISCTASLVSDKPKKGPHRCHVAAQTASRSASYSLVLEKGVRNRFSEDRIVGQLILLALAEATGIADAPEPELRAGEAVVRHEAIADPLLIELLSGQRSLVWSVANSNAGVPADSAGNADSCIISELTRPPVGVLCGSFHPLHDGHLQLRAVAERILNGPVYYEISVRNVDKPPLDFLSINRRRRQFTDVPLALTTAPTFAEKSKVLSAVTFVVGADTAERIVQAKYYGGGYEATRQALSRVRAAGCRFLVAGRLVQDRFETLSDVEIPAEFSDLFIGIPADEFRVDISSTQLRRAGQASVNPDPSATP
jgi:nicotinic acid mononucleotide adenylyltransferase/nicotinamide mononucleotide (NMN) deamidase PncC